MCDPQVGYSWLENRDLLSIFPTVTVSGPVMVCHITVDSPYQDTWQATCGDVADLDWSTHGPRGGNPQRIRTPGWKIVNPIDC